jgi:NAD-dependent deacetylase
MRIITQNVDGLHAVAVQDLVTSRGASSTVSGGVEPLELHGSLFRVRCTACGRRRPHVEPVDASSRELLPHCDDCRALLRPDVVWFGEPLDDRVLGAAVECARRASLSLVVGTSAVVQPAASLAMVTKRSGGAVIEINPAPTPLTPFADVSIRATAVEAVPRIVG